ncbi:DUF5057 domain-containing protein [Histomonas meleagridis]|uniref:DUF5057 domain-containing protein n=1 Tax=Histomonas meleagridis TaxID=135588 RepID=UPI0035593966|nr:DUF5057 domain-containing protein [Histomonas meleagridis]KAH0799674.1 DUF5057 domain-containing protein [Histomonas meleagridis]
MFLFLLSLTYEESLKITATVNTSYANGKGGTYLSWTNLSDQSIFYKLFQKSYEDDEWTDWKQISTYLKGSRVNVLNIYPSQFDGNKGQAANNQGQYNSYKVYFKFGTDENAKEEYLPKSAALKVWMEGGYIRESGHTEKFDPYGVDTTTGEQLIYVDPISINTFESRISSECKVGSDDCFIYDYEVIVFGTWDANSGYSIKTTTAKNFILPYIEKGYGFLTGHDSISQDFSFSSGPQSLLSIREKFGIYAKPVDNTYTGNGFTGTPYYQMIKSKTISIQREGLLTNYPYEIGKTGTVLTIPEAHTTYQAVIGDVWMTFNKDTVTEDKYGLKHNFYLTTKDNTAMIQTGHSNCDSTEDERKVIANTIYYLNQRTTYTFAEDHSSQDNAAPTIQDLKYKPNEYGVEIESTDKGSKYRFKVEAYNRNDFTKPYLTSDEVEVTVTTGVDHYIYAITDKTITSTNQLTLDTKSTFIPLNSEQISNGMTVYVAAVDGAGKVSDIASVKIPVPAATPSRSPSPSASASRSPSASASRSPSASPSASPSVSQSPHPTPTQSPLEPTRSPSLSQSPMATPSQSPMATPTRSPSRSFPPYLSSDQYSEWLRQQYEEEQKKNMTYYIAGGVAVGVVAIVAAAVAVFLKFGSKPPVQEIGEGYNQHVEKDATVNYENPLYNEAADDPFAEDFDVQAN